MRNIVEDFDPSINVEGGSIDINDEAVVDAINRNLSAVTADSGVTPYVKLEKIRKILAYYKIFIPHTVFLEGDEGNEVFEISQFGEKSGVTNDAEFKEKKSDNLYLYFEWMTNDDGLVDVFSEIVDEDDLEEILADYEDESEEDDEEDSDGAEVSYDAYKASNMAEETQEENSESSPENRKMEYDTNRVKKLTGVLDTIKATSGPTNDVSKITATRDMAQRRITQNKAVNTETGFRGTTGAQDMYTSWGKEPVNMKKARTQAGIQEETQLDELSKDFVARVAKAAIADSNRGTGRNQGGPTGSERWHNKRRQKLAGKAIDKLSGNAKVPANEETQLDEGRPSQRHPLEGHPYHKKTNAELIYIAKDANKAAEAMKGHNTEAENKYRDQVNDSATVRHFRKKSGMPNWYKKKYGHDNK